MGKHGVRQRLWPHVLGVASAVLLLTLLAILVIAYPGK